MLVTKLDFWVASVLRLFYFSEMPPVTFKCLTSRLARGIGTELHDMTRHGYMSHNPVTITTVHRDVSWWCPGRPPQPICQNSIGRTKECVEIMWVCCGLVVLQRMFSFQNLTQFGDNQKTSGKIYALFYNKSATASPKVIPIALLREDAHSHCT